MSGSSGGFSPGNAVAQSCMSITFDSAFILSYLMYERPAFATSASSSRFLARYQAARCFATSIVSRSCSVKSISCSASSCRELRCPKTEADETAVASLCSRSSFARCSNHIASPCLRSTSNSRSTSSKADRSALSGFCLYRSLLCCILNFNLCMLYRTDSPSLASICERSRSISCCVLRNV